MSREYSFDLYEPYEAINAYGLIETRAPTQSTVVWNDFLSGEHFRTTSEAGTGHLVLELEDRLITLIVDGSGSMMWNDYSGDRYNYCKRLLTKLKATYPANLYVNLITFGGIPIKVDTVTFKTEDPNDEGVDGAVESGISSGTGLDSVYVTGSLSEQVDDLLRRRYEQSAYSFAGVRVVRRSDRYPTHPADGVIVEQGVIDATKDDDLTEGQKYYYGIWTYNKNLHFSRGSFINATPRDRIIPKGVNGQSAIVRRLTGVLRDADMQLIYNFVEGSGTYVFDSSGNGYHGALQEDVRYEFWQGDASSGTGGQNPKAPAGVRFDGQYDIIEASVDSGFTPTLSSVLQPFTLNFWIYRYDVPGVDQWVIGTTTDTISNDIGWAIYASDDSLKYAHATTSNVLSTLTGIPLKTWTMVTFVLNGTDVSWYLNGVFQKTDSAANNIGAVVQEKLYIGGKIESESVMWGGQDFYGVLGSISVAGVARDAAYIEALYVREVAVFTQTLLEQTQNPPDNTQREVLLSWLVGDDYDYEGGVVRIVRKKNEIPTHHDDGEIVAEVDASPGTFYYLDAYDFVNGENYYYRIFSFNALGNPCDRDDSRALSACIPYAEVPSDLSFETAHAVSDLTATPGNRRVWLKWTNPSGAAWIGVKVFYSGKTYPAISRRDDGSIASGDGYQACDTTDNRFIHRSYGMSEHGTEVPLENFEYHFYTVVAYDRLGRFSDPAHVRAIPDSTVTTVFPPEEVTDVHVVLINPTTLSIQWTNPIVNAQELNLWMNETATLLLRIRDIYGGQIENTENISLSFCTDIESRSMFTSEEPLGKTKLGEVRDVITDRSGATAYEFTTPLPDKCNSEQEAAESVITSIPVEGGILQGIVTHIRNPNLLARREKYTIDLAGKYIIRAPDAKPTDEGVFQFYTKPVRITFQNPLQMTMVNLLKKRVCIRKSSDTDQIRGDHPCVNCKKNKGGDDDYDCYNGGYIKAKKPYICRIELQYKGSSLPDGTAVTVRLYKHGEGDSFLRDAPERTTIREGAYRSRAVAEQDIDFDGMPTGRIIRKSIVDVEVPHPSLPDWVDIYAVVEYNGLMADAVHSVRFHSIVNISLNSAIPEPNGLDVAEQFASVHIVDPDNPSHPAPPPDGTLVKWQMTPLAYGRNRPFYSVEQLAQRVSGVYSTTKAGIARNVFFGPVSELTCHAASDDCSPPERCFVAEDYMFSASVVIDESQDEDREVQAYGCGMEERQYSNRRFLFNIVPDQDADFGAAPNHFTWGDGIHMLKFVIAKNPAISTIDQADCFRHCVEAVVGGQLYAFGDGQIVYITAPGDILWEVEMEIDEYTGEQTLKSYKIETKDPETGLATAKIPIDGEETEFWIRNNIVDPQEPMIPYCTWNGEGKDPCSWSNVCSDEEGCAYTSGRIWAGVSPITGVANIIVNNKSVPVYGGGDYETGIPPLMLGWKEPLSCRVVNARIGDQTVTELRTGDGSVHTFVVEVKFAGEPVPDGTPIALSVQGQDASTIQLTNNTIYTVQTDSDPILCIDGRTRSLAYFSIAPLPNIALRATITASCEYDKLGEVKRKKSHCIDISNQVTVSPQPPKGAEEGTEGTTAEENPTVISREILVYNTLTDTYSLKTGMTYSRVGAFVSTFSDVGSAGSVRGWSASSANVYDIYVFGGYNGNRLAQTCEAYSTVENAWHFTTVMPTPRAYGVAAAIGRKIYCIGGIQQPEGMAVLEVSRKVEIYDLVQDTWSTGTNMPEDYGVAWGKSFVIGNKIYVVCGATTIIENCRPGTLNDKLLVYDTSSGIWSSYSVSDADLYGRLCPTSFVRSVGSQYECYVLGGSIAKTEEQIQAEKNAEIDEKWQGFMTDLAMSIFYASLAPEQQQEFLKTKRKEIEDSVIISPFVYPPSGFHFDPQNDIVGSELDVSDTIDDEWTSLPEPRDRADAVYVASQDAAFIFGGANQNASTTLNTVEAVHFDTVPIRLEARTALSRGRNGLSAVAIGNDVYIIGGQTSGHRSGYVNIEIDAYPEQLTAKGNESAGIIIKLTNDAGQLIQGDVRATVRGRISIPEVDKALVDYLSARLVDRAAGGDGSGNAPDKPEAGEAFDEALYDNIRNKLTDPNSDEFQYNSARRLQEQLYLFPVLYSDTEVIIHNGIGMVTLLPRSEDPLNDITNLARYIQGTLENIPDEEDEVFDGRYTREELVALGDVLAGIKVPPTVLYANSYRKLYEIETIVTVVDSFYFGQSVSTLEEDLYEAALNKAAQAASPPPGTSAGQQETAEPGPVIVGEEIKTTDCYVLQHLEDPTVGGVVAIPDTSEEEPQVGACYLEDGTCVRSQTELECSSQNGIWGGLGSVCEGDPAGPTHSTGNDKGEADTGGQALRARCLLPLNPRVRRQEFGVSVVFYNTLDWLPQIQKRLIDGTATIDTAMAVLDTIDYETPFGSSQIYDALCSAASYSQGETFDSLKKVIYVLSDNSENLSTKTVVDASDEINNIDGTYRVPLMYNVMSTSFPVSLASQLQRTELGDVARLTKETGGQSTTLISSSFLDHILNLTINGATGGMGYGTWAHLIDFGYTVSVRSVVMNFVLPSNTQGAMRFKYSTSGYSYSDWSQKYYGTGTFDFPDFVARYVQIEVTLTTGFTTEITEEYDQSPTGVPNLTSIEFNTAEEQVDYLYLKTEFLDYNIQQLAATVDADIPSAASVNIGVAPSQSRDWRDFYSAARPLIEESGKTILLDRSYTTESIVRTERLSTLDGLLYKVEYGPWDPFAFATLYEITDNGKVELETGFQLFPRRGEVYFASPQPLDAVFVLDINNRGEGTVGVRLSNRSYDESIKLGGVGFIYTTNEVKAPSIAQAAPRAINVFISPASPNTNSEITGNYTYYDINGDPEKGTVIKWFVNGEQWGELVDKLTWSESDLRFGHKLEPDDRIIFSVEPSDGRDSGPAVFSPAVKVMARPPEATAVIILAQRLGSLQERHETGATFTVQYTFTPNSQEPEQGTLIQWFVNQELTPYFETTYSAGENIIKKQMTPDPVSSGTFTTPVVPAMNTTIYAKITPKTATITGSPANSPVYTVVNTIPVIQSATITPESPKTTSTLQLTLTIDDIDIARELGAIGGGLADQHDVKWYFSINGSTWTLIPELSGVFASHRSVPSSYLRTGEMWKAIVTPWDGQDAGAPEESNIVVVG